MLKNRAVLQETSTPATRSQLEFGYFATPTAKTLDPDDPQTAVRSIENEATFQRCVVAGSQEVLAEACLPRIQCRLVD
jgi:hypothetical protein